MFPDFCNDLKKYSLITDGKSWLFRAFTETLWFTTLLFPVYRLWDNKDFIGIGGDKYIFTLHYNNVSGLLVWMIKAAVLTPRTLIQLFLQFLLISISNAFISWLTGGSGIDKDIILSLNITLPYTLLVINPTLSSLGEKPFECKLCHQRSRDYSAMIKHLRTHNGASPYQCTICLEYCPSLSAMQKHMKGHKPEDIPPDWRIEKTYLYLCYVWGQESAWREGGYVRGRGWGWEERGM